MNVFDILNAGTQTVQNVWNLVKDFGNIDTERAVEAQQEVMDSQNQYNIDAFNRQAEFGRDMFNRSADLSRQLLSQEQAFNRESEDRQYNREAWLNSPSRMALLMRQAGIAPSGNTGSGSSVSAFGSPSASVPSSPSASQPGVSGGSVPGSRYSPGSSTVDTLASIENQKKLQEKQQDFDRSLKEGVLNAEKRDNNAEAQSKEIENLFKYQQLVFDLEERLARIDKLKAEGKKLTTEEESLAATYKEQIQYWRDTIDVMRRNATVAERNATTNERNADTREAELEETKRNNRVNNGIQSALVDLQERGILLNEAKLQPEIDKLIADTQLSLKNVEFTKEQIPVIRAKIESEIAKNNKLQNFIHEQAIKTKKEADLVKYQIATQMATSIINSAANVVNAVSPLKSASAGSVAPVGVSTTAPSYYQPGI